MKSLAWKLATLAAVIGIGFLVLLQAQRGMNQASLKKQAEGQAAANGPTTPHAEPPLEPQAEPPVFKSKPGTETAQTDSAADLPSQGEPQFGREPNATTATESPKPDAGSNVLQTAAGNAAGPTPAGDPFGEFNDTKHATPAKDAVKTAGDAKVAADAKKGGRASRRAA